MRIDQPMTQSEEEKRALNLKEKALEADGLLSEEQKKIAAAYLSGMVAAHQMHQQSA